MLTTIYYQFRENGSLKIWSAIDENDKWHASILTVEDHHMIYYLLGARDPDIKSNAMFLLWNDNIKKNIHRKSYNFEGSLSHNIAKVYQSFGADYQQIWSLKK